ncbi:MAG TPA: hypothetical protein VF008_25375 [Niastella sp.]
MSSFFIVRSFIILSAILYQSYFCLGQNTPSSQLILPDEHFKVPFIWKGDSINGQWENYAAMLIPVKLEGCPKQFYMQFDVGAPYSLFYVNKLKAISSHYPLTAHIPDSAVTGMEIRFTTGKTKIIAHEMMLKQSGANQINWNTSAIEIIGTLGADFIGDKTVFIDYPGKKISIGYEIPKKPGLTLTDLIYVNRSIIFPAFIKGKKTMLYFDSGSSAFELLTNKETAAMLALPGATSATYPVASWGKILTAISYASGDSIEIASIKMPLNKVTYIEGASDAQVSRMMKMGIGGMTGNKLFLHSILVLDIKNKQFGILNGR